MEGPSCPLVLYVWPSAWSLPSIDAQCIAAIFLLHLQFPGQFAIVECADPDMSPSGRLPFLAHYLHTVSPLPAISSYLASIDRSTLPRPTTPPLDFRLSPIEDHQTTAWSAYISLHLGNLVSLTLYGSLPNYSQLVRPALARRMPFHLRYYVPDRIRAAHSARLERLGWATLQDDDESVEKKQEGERGGVQREFRRAFESERTLEKARPLFHDLSELLGEKDFFFQNRITPLDILFAAHLSLLLLPPFPKPHLARLLTTAYPTLVSHTERILALVPPPDQLPKLPPLHMPVFAPLVRTLKAVPTFIPRWAPTIRRRKTNEAAAAATLEERDGLFTLGNFVWAGLAVGAVLAYAISNGWVELPAVTLDDAGVLAEGDVEEIVEEEVVLEEFSVA